MPSELLRRVESAFAELFSEDAELFQKGIHEQTIVFRLGIYLQRRFPNLHVDCEYNRQWNSMKRLESSNRLIKPDLLVHRRLQPGDVATDDNLLVLEAKKTGSWRRTFAGLERRLNEMTRRGRFSYKFGMCWKLAPTSDATKHEITWFRQGQVITATSASNFAGQILHVLGNARNA